MNEYVMRHPKLPGQPIIKHAHSEAELSSGNSPLERAGWRLAKTDPEKVRAEAEAAEPAEPVKTDKKSKE